MTKKELVEEKIKRTKKRIVSTEEKLTELNDELAKWVEELEKTENSKTIDIFILFYGRFKQIYGVFDSAEKAKNGKSELIKRYYDCKYEKFSIEQHNISKPIDNKVFALLDCDNNNLYGIFGSLDELNDFIYDFYADTFEDHFIINEIV